MDEQELRAEWLQWREGRMAALREPHGWLTLESLEWLTEEPRQLENFPGLWSAFNHELRHDVTVTFTAEDEVSGEDGQVMVGTYDYSMPVGDQDITLLDGHGQKAEVASRFGRMCVRVRNPEAPTRQDFTETDTYGFDPEWIVVGQWKPDSAPWPVRVPSAHAGGLNSLTVQGEATILGQTVLVTGDSERRAVIFHDATNYRTTEAWRVAPATISEDQQTVVVDFNRAVNFPAHFTRFGTCPTPPAQNRFQGEITAGEKKNK